MAAHGVAHAGDLVGGQVVQHPDRDVYEDRELELTAQLSISVGKQIAEARSALG